MLEDGKPRHQSRRQRRPADTVLVDGTELAVQESPVDRPRQPHQRVIHIDDLIEPRAKQILLAALPPFPWPHRTLRQRVQGREITAAKFEGIPNANLQENPRQDPQFRQIPSPGILPSSLPLRRFGIFHGRLTIDATNPLRKRYDQFGVGA